MQTIVQLAKAFVYYLVSTLASFEVQLFIFKSVVPVGQTRRHREQKMDSREALRALSVHLEVYCEGTSLQAAMFERSWIQTANVKSKVINNGSLPMNSFPVAHAAHVH